jgi:uncharacterized lipoprotein YddW (UPF0748 family)
MLPNSLMRLPRFLILCACVAFGSFSRSSVEARADDVRALWVKSSTLTSPASIDAMVRAAVSGGFNTLLVQVRARGEAYYQSAIEPRASELDAQPASFDPLATTLQLAKASGLRVHAWVNVNFIASAKTLPHSRDHVITRHPEWLMVPKALSTTLRAIDVHSPGYIGPLVRWTRTAVDDGQTEGLYLSPIAEASREYTASVVAEIASKYAVDGIHLDYARFPSDAFDYSAATLNEFKATRVPLMTAAERQRLERLAVATPAIWANMYPDAWADFRRDRMTRLVTRLSAVARAARPDLIVSAAVAPNGADARDRVLQDWPGWVNARLVDVICPMAYTTNLDEFTTLVSNAAKLAEGRAAVWAGIGAYRLPVADAADHVRAALKLGAAGVVLFSYDTLTAVDSRAPSYFAELKRLLLAPTDLDRSR